MRQSCCATIIAFDKSQPNIVRLIKFAAAVMGSAGHASATANLKLTFHVDHSAGADHSCGAINIHRPGSGTVPMFIVTVIAAIMSTTKF
jgi:hypothetical protein